MATSTILNSMSIDTKEKGKKFVEALRQSSKLEVKISEIKRPLDNKETEEFLNKFADKYE